MAVDDRDSDGNDVVEGREFGVKCGEVALITYIQFGRENKTDLINTSSTRLNCYSDLSF